MTRIEKTPSVTEIGSALGAAGTPPEEKIGNIHGESELLGYDVGITHAEDADAPPAPAAAPTPKTSEPETLPAPAAESETAPDGKNIFKDGIKLQEVVVKPQNPGEWRKEMEGYLKKEVMNDSEKQYLAKYIMHYHNRYLPEGYDTVREPLMDDADSHVRYYGKVEGNKMNVESLLISHPDKNGKHAGQSTHFAELSKRDDGTYILKTSNDGLKSSDAFAFKVTDDDILIAGTVGHNPKTTGKRLEEYYGITKDDLVTYIALFEENQTVRVRHLQ